MTRPLRIAHISDTHLGYRALPSQDPLTSRNQRAVDVEKAFAAAVDDILRQQPDLVLHAGDVFHQSRPNWYAVRHFVMQMRRIEDAGIPAVVIAGNHDTPRYRAGGSVFSVLEVALPKIRISAGYEEEAFTFDDLDLRVQTLPHGALTNPDEPVPYAVPGVRNILLTHGMAAGVLAPGKITEPGEQELDNDLFESNWDYIALGHYHLSMSPFAGARYAGSTERFGWGDFEATPGYLIVTMAEDGTVAEPEHRAIPARPMALLEPVYGNRQTPDGIVEDVLGQIERLGKPEAMTRVQVREIDRLAYREVERRLKREARDAIFSLTVSRYAPDQGEVAPELDPALRMHDLKTLFAEFVANRKGEHYSDAFATAFLERGTRALDEAQRIVTESQAEGGGA
jgi:DNA repair exonuclease SbcCD nuclease subunit